MDRKPKKELGTGGKVEPDSPDLTPYMREKLLHVMEHVNDWKDDLTSMPKLSFSDETKDAKAVLQNDVLQTDVLQNDVLQTDVLQNDVLQNDVLQNNALLDSLKDDGFVLPGPNPQRIPHDEMLNFLKSLSNMHLAHEIAISRNFRLESFTPPEDSTASKVKKTLHDAFWNVFEENIKADPPNWEHAIQMFEEMRSMLLNLLLPHNRNMRIRIQETLDVDFIKQQVEHGALDFNHYATFVVDTVSQLCCPSRDPEVAELRKLESPAAIFRGIMELMGKMNLDMANYYLDLSRPHIVANCVTYERLKFAEFLEMEYKLREDGLRVTRAWLKSFMQKDEDEPSSSSSTISDAMAALIAVDYQDLWPETLMVDYQRLQNLALKVQHICVMGTVSMTVAKMCETLHKAGSQQITYIQEMAKNDANILISPDDMKSPELEKEAFERYALQACDRVDKFLNGFCERSITPDENKWVHKSIMEITNRQHSVRGLILRRFKEYMQGRIECMYKSDDCKMPALFMGFNSEVNEVAEDVVKICIHNRAVFDDLYHGIIREELLAPKIEPQTKSSKQPQYDPEFQKVLSCLRHGKEKTILRPGGEITPAVYAEGLSKPVHKVENSKCVATHIRGDLFTPPTWGDEHEPTCEELFKAARANGPTIDDKVKTWLETKIFGPNPDLHDVKPEFFEHLKSAFLETVENQYRLERHRLKEIAQEDAECAEFVKSCRRELDIADVEQNHFANMCKNHFRKLLKVRPEDIECKSHNKTEPECKLEECRVERIKEVDRRFRTLETMRTGPSGCLPTDINCTPIPVWKFLWEDWLREVDAHPEKFLPAVQEFFDKRQAAHQKFLNTFNLTSPDVHNIPDRPKPKTPHQK